MQPCLIYLHDISLVVCSVGGGLPISHHTDKNRATESPLPSSGTSTTLSSDAKLTGRGSGHAEEPPDDEGSGESVAWLTLHGDSELRARPLLDCNGVMESWDAVGGRALDSFLLLKR